MKIPLSWLKDFVDIDLPLDKLAKLLTMAGLEVEEVRLVGLPMPSSELHEFKFSGLSWESDKFVVAQIDEIMPHPNADRLVLCRLNDGQQEIIVLTGAPNLYPYKGQGALPRPLKVAYAKEGARLYDGHQAGQVLTTLKRTKIRGFDSFSMVCSEKELGISDEHEGVMILDEDAPTGMPLVDYMGDAVFEISILPNMIRNACILGMAREVAALTGKPLRKPVRREPCDGPSIEGQVFIQISDPNLNPRFVFGLIRGANPKPSPYWVQLRLRLAGMRPINSLVDATNYVMLEIGQPLHAFDYDVLVQRAGGQPPTIMTRPAKVGERLTTLDGVERKLDPFTIMVTDTAGALSLAGVMGGAESEITENTRNVLLEGATWNFVNIRKTITAQKLNSEAAYRFSRGIHPALAMEGVQLGLDRMAEWGGGQIAAGLVDEYPKPAIDPLVSLRPQDVRRHLGIDLSTREIADLLSRLEFECRIQGETVLAKTPPHRLDIGEGLIGLADVLEEIARMYGYDAIQSTRLADTLPPQRNNPSLENEEKVKDILAGLGLQEVITYRLTSPEKEARLRPDNQPQDELPYVRLQNPITPERVVMRHSLLASVLEIMERNIRLSERLALFEVGPVFIPKTGQELPYEPTRLAIALSGLRSLPAWDTPETKNLDFFDLKGILEALLAEIHLPELTFEPASQPAYHPGKCANLISGQTVFGVFGELHPLVKEHFDFGAAPVLAAEIDLELMMKLASSRYEINPVPVFPPVLEDIAVIVDEETPAASVVAVIRQAGGKLLSDVHLFDTFRGGQIGAGKKSLAYALTYMAPDRTLTDAEAAQIRQRIIRRLEQELGARLRS
ncbi:MAG TPA: phenylalanine--tRNA ligase subunit beta [Anaerolineaceae bacterium]|nr:phenylalanine--tRNA ligase subunit beta [Anaerolineaceae bacterium]